MANTKWEGVLAKPMSHDLNGKELIERIDALLEYYGITDDFSTDEVTKYRVLIAMLAQKLKIPGFSHEKFKSQILEETREFIFWMEFNKLKLEKGYKKISDTADFFKYMPTDSEILKSYQKKAINTIIDNYKTIVKNNKLAKEFKESKKYISNCVIENYNKLPFKVAQKYYREIPHGTNKVILELINEILQNWYKLYYEHKQMLSQKKSD